MNVLIVDDDPVMLRATARCLRSLGWTVSTSEKPIPIASDVDVVLADWDPHGRMMIQVCLLAGCPVVVYTGAPDSVDVPVTVLPKPSEQEAIDKALRSKLG